MLDWKVDCIYGRIVGGLDIVCFLVGWFDSLHVVGCCLVSRFIG